MKNKEFLSDKFLRKYNLVLPKKGTCLMSDIKRQQLRKKRKKRK